MQYRYYHFNTQGSFRNFTIEPLIKWLIIINCGIFIYYQLFKPALDEINFIMLFGVVPHLIIKNFTFWQLVTYMFLHGNIGHLLLNMFGLWMFGTDLLRIWGNKRFIKYYFITGVGSGIINVLFSFNSSIPTIGASGAIFGLLVAYALYYPNRLFYIYFLFPVKAKHLVIFFGIIEFLSLADRQSGISNITHLGGLLVGYIYLKGVHIRLWLWLKSIKQSLRLRRMKKRVKVINRDDDFNEPPIYH